MRRHLFIFGADIDFVLSAVENLLRQGIPFDGETWIFATVDESGMCLTEPGRNEAFVSRNQEMAGRYDRYDCIPGRFYHYTTGYEGVHWVMHAGSASRHLLAGGTLNRNS